MRSERRPHGRTLRAQAVDFDLDLVADGEVREATGEADPLGGARVDEVTRFEHGEPAEPVHDLGDIEDEVAGVRVLARFAVDARSDAESAAVADLGGGDKPRSERVEGLEALALAPLTER